MNQKKENDADRDMKLKLRQFFERESAGDAVRKYFYSKKFENDDDSYLDEEEEEEEEGFENKFTTPVLTINVECGIAFDIFSRQDGTTVKLDVECFGNKYSYSYIPASQKMIFQKQIKKTLSRQLSEFIEVNNPIRFCISTDFPKNQFIGLATFDWRKVIPLGSTRRNVEMTGISNEIVGVLQISLELSDFPNFADYKETVRLQIKQEKIDAVEAEREFSKSMRVWWLDLMRLTDKKNIEITSKEIGSGPNIIFKQVTPFFIRGLNTPGNCLRFCHMLTNLIAPLGHAYLPVWATLSSRSGREREKLNLLVSLLRGMKLNAYVVVSKPRAIAVCLEDKPIYFDVVTGKFGPTIPKIVQSIAYIYNESILYANLYPSKVDWELKSPLKWKPLYPPEWEYSVDSVPCFSKEYHFQQSQGIIDEKVIEIMVKKIIDEQRSSFCMKTVWSYELAEILHPIVSTYEKQKQIGKQIINFSNDAIKKNILPFHTLKAVPAMTNTWDPLEIFRALMSAKYGLDILGINEKDAKFALRVSCTQYPEGVVAVWAILAVECITSIR